MDASATPALSFPPPRLQLRGITKRYASTTANQGVDLTVMPGEIHALLGENGAGKSTLVKIIYGVVKPDEGAILWEGAPVSIPDPNAARALGVGMVFQHFSLFETLTVAENIALGLGSRDRIGALAEKIRDVGDRYGLTVEPHRHVHHLSVGERQRVEIVRCLLQEPTLLIMDEPTSVLTPREVEGLFVMLRRLSSEGCSILYISHKLDEIKALCQAATVLRAGLVTGHCDPRRETPTAMAELMIGSRLPQTRRTAPPVFGAPALVINGLSLPSDEPFGTDLVDINLSVAAGEIVGIAGVAGNGQKELLAAISGERRLKGAGSSLKGAGSSLKGAGSSLKGAGSSLKGAGSSLKGAGGSLNGIAAEPADIGTSPNAAADSAAARSRRRDAADIIAIASRTVGTHSATQRRRQGLAFIPEERLGRGAVAEMSLAENALLTCYPSGFVRHGFVRFGKLRAFADGILQKFRVRAAGIDAEARSLSGGNMQKFIIGREVGANPRVLVAAHPTWGVDIGAALAIRQELMDLTATGVAILVVSEDLAELFEICDRIAVLHAGRLSVPRPVGETTMDELGLLMGGVRQREPADA